MRIPYKEITVGLLCSLTLLSTFPTQAAPFWKKKKKEETQREVIKTTPYDKIFEKAKNPVHKKGILTIHRIEDEVYLEIPFQYLNKEWLLNSYITGSNDVSILAPGINCAPAQRIRIEQTDSLVLFRKPTYDLVADKPGSGVEKALTSSTISPIVNAFPILAVNNDSTALIFNATAFFSGNNKEILDLRGMSVVDGMTSIYDNNCIDSRCMLEAVDAFGNSISVSSEMGIRLTLAFIMGISADKPEISAKVTTTLTLLPEQRMKPRKADGRIGTAFVKYRRFGENSSEPGFFAARYQLIPKDTAAFTNGHLSEPVRPITFYIDTLFTESWYQAIRNGILRWEKAFEGAGFKNAIVVERYPSDSTFQAGDPLNSCIRFTGNTGVAITMRRLADPRSGEILSVNLNIPRDYASTVRKEATYTIADVDKRYSTYFISDEAICEVLSAQVMQKMATAFGLAANLAGSTHYTIAQLRSPEFTQQNGISTSVTDDVLFNYVALPGDKERGVVTLIQKPGIYDEFAIKWLYTPIVQEEDFVLNQWLQEKAMDERFFWGKRPGITYAYDPRCQAGDLSNDIFSAADHGIAHLKYLVTESPKWLTDERIPQTYLDLFPDFVFLKVYAYLGYMFNYIGGIYQQEPHVANTTATHQPVPRALQRKAMRKILEICEDFSWMDTNKAFLFLGGPNATMSNLGYTSMPMPYLMSRISRMALSVEKSDNPYTQQDALDDLTNYIFQDVRKGKPLTAAKKIYATQYVAALLNGSNTLMTAYKKARSSGNAWAEETNDLTESLMQGIHKLARLQQAFRNLDVELDDLTPNKTLNSFQLNTLPKTLNSVVNQEGGRSQGAVETLKTLYYYFPKDTELIYYNELIKVEHLLQQAKNRCSDVIEKGTYQYYLNIIDLALHHK